MDELVTLANHAIEMFQQAQPWLEKAGSVVLTQGVKELWDYTKKKLGGEAVAKVEAKPDSPAQWEILKGKLLEALEDDQAFREKIKSLAPSVDSTINQTAIGNDNKQAAVVGSQNVKISY